MKKSIYLIVIALILGLVLTGCSLLSNISQVPATGQSGMSYLTKAELLPGDLVGLWHFDEGEGVTAYDSSGTIPSNDGTVYGAGWVDGKFGKALSFNGVNDYVEVADSASLRITGELTIEAWVNEAVSKTQSKIVSRRSGTYFYFLGVDNGKPYGGIGDGSTRTVTDKSFTMPSNEWHHLAFVYNDAENKMYLYYDGVLKETVAVTQSLPAKTGVELSIGADHQGTAVFFNGLIDEVRIWNFALSQDQLGKVYDFEGFFRPIDIDNSVFNVVKAGRAIPVKFSLNGYQGLDMDNIFVPGYPKSIQIKCPDTDDELDDEMEFAETAGESSLSYDADADQYIYVWKTEKDWTGCRQLIVKLIDGTSHEANFTFK